MSADLADIRRDFERVAPDTVHGAAAYAASILADVAGRRGTMDGRIAALTPTMRVCGPAFTIEVRAGDNLMIHAAMSMAQPGDVLVIDGSIRDTEELRELGFPVWAIGANPNGPTKYVPGRINWPISCGGASVKPGDLIVGDADGVVVIERERAASLLPLAAAKVADERGRIADIVSGKNLRPKWLEGSLQAAGVLKDGEAL